MWGINYKEMHEWGSSYVVENNEKNILLMSSAEKPEIADKFRQAGWEVKSLPGAGHKLLKVALGEKTNEVIRCSNFFLDKKVLRPGSICNLHDLVL